MPACRAKSRSDRAARPSARTISHAAARTVARADWRRASRQSTATGFFNIVISGGGLTSEPWPSAPTRPVMTHCPPQKTRAWLEEAVTSKAVGDVVLVPRENLRGQLGLALHRHPNGRSDRGKHVDAGGQVSVEQVGYPEPARSGTRDADWSRPDADRTDRRPPVAMTVRIHRSFSDTGRLAARRARAITASH